MVNIDRDALNSKITEAASSLLKLSRVDFKERRAIANVAVVLRKLYDEFRPYLPLIYALRSPYLKGRHWAEIHDLKTPRLEIDPDLSQSLKKVQEKGAMQFIEQINEISHFADKERKLEQQVHVMKDEWRSIKFNLIPFKDSGTHLLYKPEPIWELLDEHIQKTMVIAGSPYVKFLQQEVNYWKKTLVQVQDILEEWGKVQRGWLYLQPIFTASDISDQLPIVTAQFNSVDKQWRSTMAQTLMNPNVLEGSLQSKLIETFNSCNEKLEKIQRGLAEYLTKKRLKFPRFFFLPNDDMLQILSKIKEP